MPHSVEITASLSSVVRYEGGGKTFSLLALFLLLSRFFPGSRWAIVRKDLPTIKKNLLPSWNKIKPTSFIKSHNNDTHTVTFKNDSQIIFWPESFSTDKDHDRWKGLEVNGFGFEEINECQQSTLFKAFERSGSYVIPNQLGIDGNYHASLQPKPIVVATCNPTQGWLKNLVYTPFMEGTLKKRWHYIQSRIYDNIPLLTAQPDYLPNLLENLNRYEIEVFVEGRWDVALQTGGEFLRSLDLVKHTKPVEIDLSTIIHVSIDSNVYPHIAATVWQLIKNGTGWIIRQVGEVPAADPDNTASRAGKKMCSYLRKIDYKGAVYLYGDRSTKSRNNIDDDKRSFFQIYNEQLIKSGFRTEDKMPSSMPSVPSVADFVNAIFDGDVPGLSIEIGEHCKESINDYIETKVDKDGTMLKSRINHPTIPKLTYEKNGHLTDTLKDFIVQAFPDEYKSYLNSKTKYIQFGYFK